MQALEFSLLKSFLMSSKEEKVIFFFSDVFLQSLSYCQISKYNFKYTILVLLMHITHTVMKSSLPLKKQKTRQKDSLQFLKGK